jgi:hypothetical protein
MSSVTEAISIALGKQGEFRLNSRWPTANADWSNLEIRPRPEAGFREAEWFPPSARRQQKKLIYARHNKLIMVQENKLKAGHLRSSTRAAAIYSLIASAKLNGLAELHLREVLTRIADHPVNRVHELLAWNLTLVSPRPSLTHA